MMPNNPANNQSIYLPTTTSMTPSMTLPQPVSYILDKLTENNHKAYIVGGCVRDILLNKTPKDWDITTSATPEEVTRIFKEDYTVIPTGISHGTVTIITDDDAYEITTFRIDGKYSDKRRPDNVEFTSSIEEDLSRRDFTINAMAYNPIEGLIDPFDGRQDIQDNIIRCVGNPIDRFDEDPLRMLRAIRFSGRLGFTISQETFDAIINKHTLIEKISSERINKELSEILINDFSKTHILMLLSGLTQVILPELANCLGVKQVNPYHKYDVYEHSVYTLSHIPQTLYLKLTMLFHDLGKVSTKITDELGIDHFYGHAKVSAYMALRILKRLKYDNNTISKVFTLIKYHDAEIHPTIKSVKRWLNKLGEDVLRDLIKVKFSDMKAQSKFSYENKWHKLTAISILLNQVIAEQSCFSKKDLAINGNDLIKLGIPQGKCIGKVIDILVELVIDNPDMNNKESLTEYALKLYY